MPDKKKDNKTDEFGDWDVAGLEYLKIDYATVNKKDKKDE